MSRTKKKWQFPHEFLIVLGLTVLACILTYVIPAGVYERVTLESGSSVVNPESFQFVENTPVPLWRIPMAVVEGFYNARQLIFAILIFTGAMQIIMSTGTIQALTSTVIRKSGKKQTLAIVIIMAVIAVLSSPMGYNPFIAFVPMILALAVQMGYDTMTGIAMITLAAAMGPNAGMLNPSTTGLGNELAGLPTFYGFGYRLIGFALMTAASIVYVIRYANRVKADPTKSLVYNIPQSVRKEDKVEDLKLSKRQIAVLVVVVAGMAILIYGCTALSWGFQEMSAFFLVFGPVGGLVYGMGANEICNRFVDGCRIVTRAVILIGLAYSISVILSAGSILDTVVWGVSNILNYCPTFLQAPCMLVIHTIVNFFITSGNGQAVVTMPIMLPVANIIGMSPETAILALNYGESFTNLIFPHSSALMGFLALSDVPYQVWLKFFLKLLAVWYVIGVVLLMIAQAIGY